VAGAQLLLAAAVALEAEVVAVNENDVVAGAVSNLVEQNSGSVFDELQTILRIASADRPPKASSEIVWPFNTNVGEPVALYCTQGEVFLGKCQSPGRIWHAGI